MARKEREIREQEAQSWWRMYHDASLVKEIYPQLVSLTIEMNFKDPDGGTDPEPQQTTYPPNSKAFFRIKCPNRECINGGFDLSQAVAKGVADKSTHWTGTATCQGWQDRERINKFHCLLEMTYRTTATYR